MVWTEHEALTQEAVVASLARRAFAYGIAAFCALLNDIAVAACAAR